MKKLNLLVVEGNLQKENDNLELSTCFDRFPGNDLFNIKRNGLVLSTIRVKN